MKAAGALLVTQLLLAEIFGADRNTLALWTRGGMPVSRRGRGSRGHAYDVGACVRWIRQRDGAQHARALAAAKAASDVGSARGRKLLADARRAEFDLRQREGEFVLVADVERRWARLVTEARNQLLGVSSRLRGRRPTLTDADLATVDAAIRESLEALADRSETPSPERVISDPSRTNGRPPADARSRERPFSEQPTTRRTP